MISHKESMGRVLELVMFDRNIEFADERDYIRRAGDRGVRKIKLPKGIKEDRRFAARRMTDKVLH